LCIPFAYLGISQLSIQQGVVGPFVSESHSENRFGAFLVDFSEVISVGSFNKIFVGFSVASKAVYAYMAAYVGIWKDTVAHVDVVI